MRTAKRFIPRKALGVILILFSVLDIEAQADFYSLCRAAFKGLRRPLSTVSRAPVQWKDWTQLSQKLRVAHHSWISNKSRLSLDSYDPRDDLSAGDTLKIGQENYAVADVLGKGAQGIVYLIRHGEALWTAKKFYVKKDAGRAFKALREMSAVYSLAHPKIIEVDKKQGVLLLEYHRGIPMDELLQRGKSLGLDLPALFEIQRTYRTIIPLGSALEPANVILDVDEGIFYLIDAW